MLLMLIALACESEEKSPITCTAVEIQSINLEITNSSGELIEPDSVTYSVDGGEDTPIDCIGGSCMVGSEQVGDFTITATSNEVSETITVTVESDECHVITEDVTIMLPIADLCEDVGGNLINSAELIELEGCGDMALYAMNSRSNATVLMAFHAEGHVETSQTAEQPYTSERFFPEAGTLTIKIGQHLEQLACNDSLTEEPIVEHTFSVLSGKANVAIEPLESGNNFENHGTATVILSNIILADDETEECLIEMDDFQWTDIFVGWLPG
jgi:hypothetical protein